MKSFSRFCSLFPLCDIASLLDGFLAAQTIALCLIDRPRSKALIVISNDAYVIELNLYA